MSTSKKGLSSTQGRLSRRQLIELAGSETEEDWKKLEASLDAEIEAMSPQERAELDAIAERLRARVGKLLAKEVSQLK